MFCKKINFKPCMKRSRLFIMTAIVACLASVSNKQVLKAQTPGQYHVSDIARYSGEYVDAAGSNAALFVGRLQSVMPHGMNSLYLRERGVVERDQFGYELFPEPVPPTESFNFGDLFYDGVLYSGVRMRLDLYRDELVAVATDNLYYGAVSVTSGSLLSATVRRPTRNA